ncbi:hypothetical protein V6N13_103207 [Hibiscus sabdariffa]
MEVFISIVGSLVGKAAEYTVDPAARQLSYLFKPRTKFLNLHSKVQDLKDARERLQQSVDSANRNGEVIFDDVQRWLTEVNEKISEQAATQLQEDEEKAIKRFIEVKNCNMLQNLFSSSIVKRLCQLEKLEVSNCENFIGLVVEKEEIDENDILEFNKLRILKLNQLNRFNGLWYSKNTLQLSACLFDKKVNFPVLEELEIRGMDNLERLWADQLVEHSFSKLTSIDLRDCPKLMNVFPLSMLTRLQRLERLVIWNCPSVEEIISEEGCISSSSSGISSLSLQFIQSDVEFSNLTSLFLLKLPNLKSIHHKKMLTINWPSLKKLRMGGCEKVEIVFAASGESSSQQLLFWLDEVSS